ncbi:MAG: porin family protein [Planctomycetes bacterium]|nr:porin family protein [Planctomycetota bacterium]
MTNSVKIRLLRAMSIATLPVGCATALLLASPSAALADDESFSVSLGVFLTNRDSKTRIDGTIPDSGTPVDLENDLGFNKSDTVFRFDGYYRINDKHRIDFSVFDLSRSGSKQIQKEIDWNDTIYPIDTVVDANLDLAIYKLAYTWSFLRRDSGYLGLTAGLYTADIGTSLSAESIGRSSSGGVTAPLPVLGLRGQYDLSERWSLRGSAEVFAFEYGDFSGSMYDLIASVDYQVTNHVALGAGIDVVNMNVGISKPNLDGDLDWRYDGGLLFLKIDF